MILIKKPIKLKNFLDSLTTNQKLLKTVIDIDNRILLTDLDLHIDGEDYLYDIGSKNSDIWGCYIDVEDNDLIFMAMTNFKPWVNNLNEEIQDEVIKDKMRMIVTDLIVGF